MDGIVTETWPVELVVKLPWYATTPFPTSWRVTVAPETGVVVVVPSGVWSAVTVIDWPAPRTGGICASWDSSTGDAPSCGASWFPQLKFGFLVSTANAGDVDGE